MPPIYVLARDHLEQAASILKGADAQTQQLRLIVERTIELMWELELSQHRATENVIDFESFRHSRSQRFAPRLD